MNAWQSKPPQTQFVRGVKRLYLILGTARAEFGKKHGLVAAMGTTRGRSASQPVEVADVNLKEEKWRLCLAVHRTLYMC